MSEVLRTLAINSTIAAYDTNSAIVSDMNKYFSRRSDHDKIRDHITTVFGQGIKTQFDPETNKSVEMYTKQSFSEQVDAGVIEALAIGFAPKIVNPLASLFTERGQRFTLVAENDTDTKKAEQLLEYNRKEGEFKYNIITADEYSIKNGSAGILVSFTRNSCQYQYFTADQAKFFFPSDIIEDGRPRAVDTAKVEDAYMVLIQLSQYDLTNWNYLAIFARSTDYPNGRHVQFVASDGISEVPPIGSDGIIEYEIDGEYCNPLSKFANDNPDMNLPEYPIIILQGGVTDSGEVMPICQSLYEDSLTFDIHASHILGVASDAVRGTNVFKRTEEGTGKSLPRQTAGNMSLEAGIDFEHVSLDAEACRTAFEVLKDMMIHLASGYSVPDFMVVSEDHALEASSGVALQVKSRPLKKAREKRVEQNTSAINKLFDIEKIYISMFSSEQDSIKSLLLSCRLIWDPGEFNLPENKKDKAERIAGLKKNGIYDEIAAIRDWYDLSTDEDAIELYDKMKERAEKYPPLNQQQQMQVPGQQQPGQRQPRRPFREIRNQAAAQGNNGQNQ